MELSFVDRYGQWHVKPVTNGEPSSNDGLIISAYAKKAGLEVSTYKIGVMLDAIPQRNSLYVMRYPGKETPYPSRDFYLGARSLDLLWPDLLPRNDWGFCPLPVPEFNLKAFLTQGLKCLWFGIIKNDRNYFWQNNCDQMYSLAFRIPWADRYFHGGRGIFSKFFSWVNEHLSKPNSDSSQLIHWLKYDRVPSEQVFFNYFGHAHPITVQVLEKVYGWKVVKIHDGVYLEEP